MASAKPLRPDLLLSLAVGIASFFLVFGAFLVLPLGILHGLWHHPYIVAPLAILYVRWSVDGSERRDGRPWTRFSETFWLMRAGRKYFNLTLKVPDSLRDASPESQFIFALHPHGVCADYRLAMDGLLAVHLPNLRSWRVLAAGVLFKFPVVRELCLWTHCIDGSRKVAERALSKGHSLFVVPGGEKEQLLTECGKEAVYLRKRMGFVRLALKQNCPIVPVYVFGVNDLYGTSRFLLGPRYWLMQNLRVCVPLFWGIWGLPAPRRIALTVVFGEPVILGNSGSGSGRSEKEKSGQGEGDPSPEAVAAAHEVYIRALTKLFDAEKAALGYGGRELKIH